MKIRFCNVTQSPDASEGAPARSNCSNYSTERTPITALLFEAKQRVLLPLVRLNENLPSRDCRLQADRKVECSFQEQ